MPEKNLFTMTQKSNHTNMVKRFQTAKFITKLFIQNTICYTNIECLRVQ